MNLNNSAYHSVPKMELNARISLMADALGVDFCPVRSL